MLVKKFNEMTKEYEYYNIPDDWYCPLYLNDMDAEINCARCGKKILFGDGYTSRQIHNSHGLGYSICMDCNVVEWNELYNAKDGNK